MKKSLKYYSLNVRETLETVTILSFYEPPITVCIGVAQSCSKVRVLWMRPPADSQNLPDVFHLYCRVWNNHTVTII